VELDQYLGLFIDESKENLQKLNESLLKLEVAPDDLEILNDIFRVAHTLKGMSKTMGFNVIGDLTHNMENVLDPLRSGKIKADEHITDALFQCLDKLEGLLTTVIDNTYDDKSTAIDDLVKKLQGILNDTEENGDTGKRAKDELKFNQYELAIINNAKISGEKTKEITVYVSDGCILPGVRAYMVVKELEGLGEIIKTHPSTEDLESGNFDGVFKLFLITKESTKSLNEKLGRISEIEKIEIKNVNPEKVVVSTANEAEEETKEIENEQKEEKVIKKEPKDAATILNNKQMQSLTIPQTIRVSAEKMDTLMNLVGELVISKTRISQLSSEGKMVELTNSIETMEGITGNIQEIVMKLRMVPIEQVFNRFPRLVRDLSKDLRKEINLKISGKDTEIDRAVIDEIGDPLIHLIRNSIDHGLECPEDRIAADKPAKGTLELFAFNEGDNIIIKVCDDGKGIDAENIKKSAIKKGLITPEDAKTMTERESIELVFAPGFSTVAVATDLSGRGVGMDVVKSKVETLGGNVNIISKVGEGTEVTISLPSKMAIVQALLIRVGEEIYAAPLNYISEVICINQKEIKNVQNREVIILRGKTLPLIRLHRLLGVPNYIEDPNIPLTVMIVKSQGKSIGVVVSEMIGQQEVVIKPMNKKLCAEDYIAGATTLGNGQITLIINVSALFEVKL